MLVPKIIFYRIAIIGGLLTGLFCAPAQLHAQTLEQILVPEQAPKHPICGPEVKEQFAAALDQAGYHKNPMAKESIELKQMLYEKYGFCADDSHTGNPNEDKREYCGALTFVASTDYERMRCCGYDPQKKLFACPIEITLPYGFNAAPFPGSYEYVLTCVDFGGGFTPVASDRVHLANEIYGNNPDWHFAVIADAKDKLASQPLDGQTLRARSILSWNTMPTSCNDRRIVWGNAIDYQIRLDP